MALVLAFVMCLSMLQLSALAAEGGDPILPEYREKKVGEGFTYYKDEKDLDRFENGAPIDLSGVIEFHVKQAHAALIWVPADDTRLDAEIESDAAGRGDGSIGSQAITVVRGDGVWMIHKTTVTVDGNVMTIDGGLSQLGWVIGSDSPDDDPEFGSLTITKTVSVSSDGSYADLPTEFTFTVTDPEGETHDVTVQIEADGTSGSETLDNLPPGEYTVTEGDAEVPGYTLEVIGEGSVEVIAGDDTTVEITNTYTKGTTDLIHAHVLTAKFPPGLREKSLKSVRIPALFVTRQTKNSLANPHTPIKSAVP